jgi:hypothetical protein
MNTSLSFTKSLPKRPEVTGAPNLAFSFAKDFGKAALKHIQTKTIATLGMITPGSNTLQYLFDPMIYHNLSGAPTKIIRNSSNKKGEFSLIKIKIASFQLFPYLAPKKGTDPLLVHDKELTEELLVETTNVKLFDEPNATTFLPNFFIIYYGQKIPHGDITSDKVKAKMMHLGTGYDPWARIVDETLTTDKLDDLLTVADKAKKDPLLILKYFLSSWDPDASTQLASNNGPCGTITNV